MRRRPGSSHSEWLSLIDHSGPFLSLSVLNKAFPQGLDKVLTADRAYVRSAYDEWREAIETNDREKAALHQAWTDIVLERLLEFDEDLLLRGD